MAGAMLSRAPRGEGARSRTPRKHANNPRFVFWQRGGGYDRHAFEATLFAMIEYIHNNPVRRGLCAEPTDWIWSSANFYAGEQNVPLGMDECLWY
jgi:hypothetical protein